MRLGYWVLMLGGVAVTAFAFASGGNVALLMLGIAVFFAGLATRVLTLGRITGRFGVVYNFWFAGSAAFGPAPHAAPTQRANAVMSR